MSPRTGAGRRSLFAALGFATVAVAFWWLTERAGHGDLRLYLFVQFLPMLLVPLGLLLRPQGDDAGGHAGSGLVGRARAATSLAKLFEIADQPVFAALGGLSGHTLKHLAAAAGAGLLLRAVVERRPRASAPVVGVDLHVVVAQVAGPDRGRVRRRGAGRRGP